MSIKRVRFLLVPAWSDVLGLLCNWTRMFGLLIFFPAGCSQWLPLPLGTDGKSQGTLGDWKEGISPPPLACKVERINAQKYKQSLTHMLLATFNHLWKRRVQLRWSQLFIALECWNMFFLLCLQWPPKQLKLIYKIQPVLYPLPLILTMLLF